MDSLPAAAREKEARAIDFVSRGDHRAAASAYRAALAAAGAVPPCAETAGFRVSCLTGIAASSKVLQDWDAVIKAFTDAIAIAPSLTRAYYGRAEAYLLTEKSAEARADLIEALKLARTTEEKSAIRGLLDDLQNRAAFRKAELERQRGAAEALGVTGGTYVPGDAPPPRKTMAETATWWQAGIWFVFSTFCLTPFRCCRRGTRRCCEKCCGRRDKIA